jgi:hypothetical protein
MMNDIEVILNNWKREHCSIAVVGNGAYDVSRGKEIDNHQIIIRFNLCVTDGYEELVGKKITVQVVGSFTLITGPHFADAIKDFPSVWSFYTKDRNMKHRSNWHMSETDYFIKAKKLLGCRKPTAGFCLLYALYLNQIKADVYGFDYYQRHPYYSDSAEKISEFFKNHNVRGYNKIHDPEMEKMFWEETEWHNFR